MRTLAATLMKFNVARVFSIDECAGDTVAIIAVLEFPPRQGCSNRVRFESLKGTCAFAPARPAPSARF